MKKHIKADEKFDKPLDEVVFSNEEGKFELSLIFINAGEKIRPERIINALIASTSRVLNFDINASTDKAIKVIGNIPEALEFLKKQKIISNELYTSIKADSELSDFFTRSGSYVMHKIDKNELSALFDSDDEDKKSNDTASNKKTTAQTPQGGVFGKSGKNPPADNVSDTPNYTQPHSPTTPVKVK